MNFIPVTLVWKSRFFFFLWSWTDSAVCDGLTFRLLETGLENSERLGTHDGTRITVQFQVFLTSAKFDSVGNVVSEEENRVGNDVLAPLDVSRPITELCF